MYLTPYFLKYSYGFSTIFPCNRWFGVVFYAFYYVVLVVVTLFPPLLFISRPIWFFVVAFFAAIFTLYGLVGAITNMFGRPFSYLLAGDIAQRWLDKNVEPGEVS